MTNRKHLTIEEFQRLKAYLNAQPDFGSMLIELILLTGMRQTEALSLESGALDESGSNLYVRGLKGSKDRIVALDGATVKRVKPLFERLARDKARAGELISGSKHNDGQSRMIRRLWGKVCRKALGETYPVTLHGLRHSWAMRLYNKSHDIMKLKMLMGHENLNSTARYVEYAATLDCRDDVLQANAG